jgi:hypothetical protein
MIADSPEAIWLRLDQAQRERLEQLARGRDVQASVTLLGWTDLCPALAAAGVDGAPDRILKLGLRVLEAGGIVVDAEART